MDVPRDVWHREVITPAIERTLRDLRQRSILTSFYLAGGTGLALQFGHRRSRDLDFFSNELFDEEMLLQKVQQLGGASVVSKARHTVHITVKDTKVSFLGYDYPLLFEFPEFADVRVADARDIACMKISAVASRGTRRDFVDLYIASQRYGLARLLEWFHRKFARASYSRIHILKSLTYFDDAEKEPELDLLVPTSWDQVKGFFTAEAPLLL